MPQRPRVESTPAEILSNASFNNKYLKMEVDNTRDIIILVVFVVAETESSGAAVVAGRIRCRPEPGTPTTKQPVRPTKLDVTTHQHTLDRYTQVV
jgi:hypothetical protein